MAVSTYQVGVVNGWEGMIYQSDPRRPAERPGRRRPDVHAPAPSP
ncbi:hypothetical protein [Streptosporangium vulgare]